MWAIDMTEVFVICKFTPSPSVLRTATSPSQEGEAMRMVSAMHCISGPSGTPVPTNNGEGVKKGGFPLLS